MSLLGMSFLAVVGRRVLWSILWIVLGDFRVDS
jgi:hypothetical protein